MNWNIFFFLLQQQTITFASFLLCISLASAQLTYHLDANTNSYTLKTPNSQQTFTRHFNSQNGAAARQGSLNHINAAAYQQPQQQVNFLWFYSSFSYRWSNNAWIHMHGFRRINLVNAIWRYANSMLCSHKQFKLRIKNE